MSLNEYAARDSRIINEQSRLLDYTGHIRAGLTRSQARRLITEINKLRRANGWKNLDMRGREREER